MANADVPIPNAVLYRASEIPTDNWAAAPLPPLSAPRLEKARIIPTTVPNNPNRVAIEAMVDKNTRFFSSIGNSSDVASSTAFCMALTFCSVLNSELGIVSF